MVVVVVIVVVIVVECVFDIEEEVVVLVIRVGSDDDVELDPSLLSDFCTSNKLSCSSLNPDNITPDSTFSNVQFDFVFSNENPLHSGVLW